MIPQLRLTDAAVRFGGTLINPDCHFDTVTIDSRTIGEGDLFVALTGERFDAHVFLKDVAEKASGLVVSKPDKTLPLPQWVVADTTRALADLAKLRRDDFTGKLIAVTGSTGKTSVKEAIASILRHCGPVHATAGNLNNHIGVPLTLLSMDSEADLAVIEMGASGGGEIAYLCDIAKPDIALINNVQNSHIEGFGSVEGIASAKGEIYSGLQSSGTAILNLDQSWCEQWRALIGDKSLITYSVKDSAADVSASDIQLLGNGCYQFVLCVGAMVDQPPYKQQVELSVPGAHQVNNALAAAACAIAAGANGQQIAAGLVNVSAVAGRLEIKTAADGSVVIDDSYNASPSSFEVAIDVLAKYPGRRVLVMGDMAELGDDAASLHRRVGGYAQRAAIDALYSLGDLSASASEAFGGSHFEDRDLLTEALTQELQSAPVTFLVKGSRSAHMEQTVDMLLTRGNA
ncbi:MAG: UDP-N-acetylmuramoyl-tripeptide--D-alanyl-D-alanine ligase [Porticoccaceae bacterium]|nr:UDP-N-acetylmuramoyl-tripeptide--D-alanyl-D-alanine ligase [Porticoccaceae bacterium]